MNRDEYKVGLRDRRGRRSFTLVNATSAKEAQQVAEAWHKAKVVTYTQKTGRSFPTF